MEAGGTIESKRVDLDGWDHEPVFLAQARLGDLSCEAEGQSKLKAEQAASAQLLHVAHGGSEQDFVKMTRRVEYERGDDEDKPNEFIAFDIDLAMNLRHDEDEKGWWIRKATKRKAAFHAAMMAPYSFPAEISMVKSWRRHDKDSGHTFVLMIVIGKSSSLQEKEGDVVVQSFLEFGQSTTSACRAVGLKANCFIANEILSLSFGEAGNDV